MVKYGGITVLREEVGILHCRVHLRGGDGAALLPVPDVVHHFPQLLGAMMAHWISSQLHSCLVVATHLCGANLCKVQFFQQIPEIFNILDTRDEGLCLTLARGICHTCLAFGLPKEGTSGKHKHQTGDRF